MHVRLLAVFLCGISIASAQTAEELVAKNTQAKGGEAAIKAITSVRVTGKAEIGPFVAQFGEDAKTPDMLRQNITLQGMTQIQAYDGTAGWQISPFEGRRDPEALGEEDLRDMVESADFYGPLIDYANKGNKIEYLGHDKVDGDDALKLKVTLKNGDILYYLLDPDTFLEIRIDKQEFIRGNIREVRTNLGSYKKVNGVYYPFSIETGPKRDPSQLLKLTFYKIEANVPIQDAEFKMPAAPAVPSAQKHPEPPTQPKPGEQPKAPDVTPH